jgi:hypothetical protein
MRTQFSLFLRMVIRKRGEQFQFKRAGKSGM